MSKMSEAIIKQCADNTAALLSVSWSKVEAFRSDDANGKLSIAIEHKLSFRDNEQMVQTRIAFGKRFKDAVESVVNPDQTDMFRNGDNPVPGDPESDSIESVDAPKKRVRRGSQAVLTAD
jgi:hypothetical protein